MKIRTRQDLANSFLDRLQLQYRQGKDWIRLEGFNPAEVFGRVKDLGPNPDPDKIDSIVGNGSWTRQYCDACSTESHSVVSLERDDDFLICAKCAVRIANIAKGI